MIYTIEKDKKGEYFIQRPDKSVVNELKDKSRAVISAYLHRLLAMGYCEVSPEQLNEFEVMGL